MSLIIRKNQEKKEVNLRVIKNKLIFMISFFLLLGIFLFSYFINFENEEYSKCSDLKSQDLRDSCYLNMAKNTDDKGPCYKINDKNKKFECLVLITDLTEAICEELKSSSERDDCRLRVIEETGDIVCCYNINDKDKRIACLAISQIEEDECNNIKSEELKDYCREEVNNRKNKVIIAAGWPGGIYYLASKVILRICNSSSESKECKLIFSRGSNDAIKKIQERKANMGIVGGYNANYAYEGKYSFENNGQDNIRGVIRMYPELAHIIVREDSDILSLNDLKGKRISIDVVDSGAHINSVKILRKAGIYNQVDIVFKDFLDSIRLLEERKIDCFVFYSFVPTERLKDFKDKIKMRLIPIDKDVIESLVKENKFYEKGIISKGTYEGAKSNISTISTKSILITNKEENEEFIYKLTKNLFENEDFFNKYIGPYITKNKEVFPIPLHEGAKKYYKEAGLI